MWGLLSYTPDLAQNLVQNGSFEVHTGPCNLGAPNGDFNDNVVGWYTTGPHPFHGYPTVDIFCGQPNYSFCTPGPPLIGSDGTVYAGFHTRVVAPPYNESIYHPLSTPLVEGQIYTLSLDLVTCQNGLFAGSDDFHVYSNVDSILPICPTDIPSVQLLGTIPNNTISQSQWQTHTFTFVAPADCNVLVFSGTCAGTPTESYYYMDNVILENACMVTLGNDVVLCDGDSTTLVASGPAGTYLWSDGSTVPTLAVGAPGTYWVQVTSIGCGLLTDTVTIAYTAPPLPDLGNDTTLCIGEILILYVATPNATYLWYDGSTSSTANVADPGIYWVEVNVGNCSAVDTIQVNYTTPGLVDLPSDTTLCDGDLLTFDVTAPNATYLWSDNSTSPILEVDEPGIYWIELTVSGCSASDTINVASDPLAALDLGNDTTLCEGNSVVLEVAIPGATYLWQDGTIGPVATITQPGSYWIEATLANCVAVDTINVEYQSFAPFVWPNDTTLCQEKTSLLDTSTLNATYLWSDNSTNATLEVAQQGTYWVQVTVDHCSASDTVHIHIEPAPSIDLGSDQTLCEGDTLVLNAMTPNATYLWSTAATEGMILVDQPGIYWVNALVNECWVSDTVVISDDGCIPILVIPNVFSPNGDGANDQLVPITSEGIQMFHMVIYNRLGVPVFETDNPLIDWTGADASDGTYYWVAEYTDNKGSGSRQSGHLTLLR